jgi:hypothetical protein
MAGGETVSDLQLFMIMFVVMGIVIMGMVAWGRLMMWRAGDIPHPFASPDQPRSPAHNQQACRTAVSPPALLQTRPHAQWWPIVTRQVHHLLLVGESQEGKTTTARALLQARALTDTILVIDPHGKLNDWGVPVVGMGRDWGAIDEALIALEQELSRRYTPDEPLGEPLSIFFDEWPAIAANCPSAKRVLLALAQEGAKARMRLVVLAQQATVEGLGIKGQGDARRNFARLLLGSFALREIPDIAGQSWPAVLDWRGEMQSVDRQYLPRLVEQRTVQPHIWSFAHSNSATAHSAHMNGHSAPFVHSAHEQNEPELPLPRDLNEQRMLVHAITLHAQGKGKQAALIEAFGAKPGGSSGWRRAVALFDAVMIQPNE